MFSRISKVEVLCLLETGYNTFMTTSNRCIPMAIAIYRYCCVFHSTWLLDIFKKKNLERIILFYVAGEATDIDLCLMSICVSCVSLPRREHLPDVETPVLPGDQEIQYLHGERGGLPLPGPGLL